MPTGIYKRTDKHKKKISLGLIGKKRKPFSKEHRRNIGLACIGRPRSEETKQKISNTMTGKPRSEEHQRNLNLVHLGVARSEKSKQKMRISAIKYIEKTGSIRVRCGKNEKQLLDKQEHIDGVIILRNCHFHQIGYFVDGYCLENNTVYEVYEKHHKYSIQKDLQRQKEIQNHLNCNFVIIWDN